MQIDDELLTYLEDLSCLTLSSEEKRRISSDLKKILEYMERLGELDTYGVRERSHPFDNVNAFRNDEVGVSLNRDLVLKNAPDKNDRMIIAPSAVD